MRKKCFAILLSIGLVILSSLGYTDEELMRKYEPFLFFHKEDVYKELFHPMDIEAYVSKCSLWYDKLIEDEKRRDEETVNSELLATFGRDMADSDKLYLKFIEEYLPSKDYWDYTQDALLEYLNASPKYTYYFRQFIEPDYGYLVLQYWFFYAFNSWGAYSFGYNIHESDWESITLFLHPVTQQPVYVAYSAHHNKEDKVRRRWDEIRKTGTHPNVFVALGSHANYFEPKFFDIQTLITEEKAEVHGPFVDRANGLGMIIGPLKPEGAFEWEKWKNRIIMQDETHSLPDWGKFYDGKWGMDAIVDKFGFSGPRFPPFQSDSDKWHRPAKWAGVPPLLLANITSVDSSDFPDIKLYTTVDAGGKPVFNLGSSNFKAYEDQTRESPISTTSVGAGLVGTSVCIVMDTSGSMEGAIGSARQAAISFVNNLKPEDKAALIRFREYVTIVQPFTDDKDTLISAIKTLYADGKTAFYDAVYKGVAMASAQPGIKAIVALTDGKDNESSKTAKEVIDYAKSVKVPVYIVGLGSEINEDVLRLIAKETEAEYYRAPIPAELQKLYESISERLKNLYEVSYTTHNPERDGTIRSVTVQVSHNQASGQDSVEYTAPTLSGAISGVVLDSETEEPVPSAKVIIEHETERLKVTDASLNTDEEGKYLVENLSPDFAYTLTASALNYHQAVYPSSVTVKSQKVTENIDFELQPMEDYFSGKRALIEELRDVEKVYAEEEDKAQQFLISLENKGASITDEEKEALQRLYLVENFADESYKDSRRLAQLATDGLGGFVDVGMAVISVCGGVGASLKKIPFVGKFLASPYIAAKNEMVNQIAVKSHIFLYQNYDVTWTLKGDTLLREAIAEGYDDIFEEASGALSEMDFSDAMAEVHKYIEKEFFLGIYEISTANFIGKSVEWTEESPPVFRVGRLGRAENRVNEHLSSMNAANDRKIKNAEMLIWAGDTIETAGAIASGVVLTGGAVLSALSTKTVVGAPLAAVLIPLSTKVAIATNTAAAGMKLGTTAGIGIYLWSTIPNYVKDGTAYSFDMSPSALEAPVPPLVVKQAPAAFDTEASANIPSILHAPSIKSLAPVQQGASDYNFILTEIREHVQNDEPEEVQKALESLIQSGELLLGDTNVSAAQILAASPRALREVADYDAIYSKFETDLSKASSGRINLYTLLASYLADPTDSSIKDLLTLQIAKTTDTNDELSDSLTSTTQILRDAQITIPTLVIIKSFSTPDVTPRGEPFLVNAVVTNIGEAPASEVNVELSLPKDSELRLKEKKVKNLGSLDAGAEQEVGFQLEFRPRRRPQESGVNLVTISISSAEATPDFDTLPPTHIFIPSPLPTPPTGGKLSNKNVYAYPNPFNPDIGPVNIRYSLSGDANVTIEIYDVRGELVTTLIESQLKQKGVEYSEVWNGKNDRGDTVANGVYFYLITTDTGEKAVGKIAVLR